MTLALYRIDDRLIHGQVVVGWGQPLNASFIVLVDDEVSSSDWEQDLYRMGVPPQIEVIFASVDQAAAQLSTWEADARVGILLVGDIDTAVALAQRAPQVRRFNVGGVHHRAGRRERLRFVYLTDDEAAKLRHLAAGGVDVTAQDVPTARAIPVGEFT
jgi:PTS system mannose-specific IIB component/fructoselysine and glucoselysine-specific PTS system IIB component